MFTGIVTAVGNIVEVKPAVEHSAYDSGVQLLIHAKDFLRSDTKVGDSIAIQGACMTVTSMARKGDIDAFTVDVSRESLNRTTGLGVTGQVNLEHSMRLGDTLDGHMVSGHVDGLGVVTSFVQVGESWELKIQVPPELARFMAYKGSVTVNGVSLTVNSVTDNANGCKVSINLIPHTLQVTTLKNLEEGQKVNLEVDLIARYVERMLQYGK